MLSEAIYEQLHVIGQLKVHSRDDWLQLWHESRSVVVTDLDAIANLKCAVLLSSIQNALVGAALSVRPCDASDLWLNDECVALAAQCEIPPHFAQYLFEIVSQRRASHPFAFVSCGIMQVSLIPLLWGGYRTSTLHALQGGNAEKRGRGYRTQLAMLRQQKPHSAQ